MREITLDGITYELVAKADIAAEVATDLTAIRVVKAAEELRLTTGLAYPAFKADVARARDGFRDFASKDVLRKCAHNYLRHPGVSLYHQDGTDGHAEVVESYVWPDGAPDWRVGEVVIKEGDWLVTCIWDEQTWPLVKAGKIRGWSPEGGCRRTVPDPERLALLR